mmetsp:Transcript_45459/g.106231  ORF Transcript_45459/g.106231 Transcript_45459/m.106231 type:complete len:206 (-) Transcript_45459:3200-3817(-)
MRKKLHWRKISCDRSIQQGYVLVVHVCMPPELIRQLDFRAEVAVQKPTQSRRRYHEEHGDNPEETARNANFADDCPFVHDFLVGIQLLLCVFGDCHLNLREVVLDHEVTLVRQLLLGLRLCSALVIQEHLGEFLCQSMCFEILHWHHCTANHGASKMDIRFRHDVCRSIHESRLVAIFSFHDLLLHGRRRGLQTIVDLHGGCASA